MFGPQGNVLQASEVLYKKNVLVLRGRFRPVTKVHLDMIESGKQQFLQEDGVKEENLSVIFELTLKDLTAQLAQVKAPWAQLAKGEKPAAAK